MASVTGIIIYDDGTTDAEINDGTGIYEIEIEAQSVGESGAGEAIDGAAQLI